jgi:acyl carrier protein
MAEGASVEDRVKQAIVRALDLEVTAAEIADDEVLFGGGLGADSVATLEIVFALEEEFGFAVDDDELRVELFDSVRSLVEYVEAKLVNAEARGAP